MHRTFEIGTPSEEKATLLQAVELLNQKIGIIQDSGKVIETEKIIILAALNLVHDLLKNSCHVNNLKDDLASKEFERKIIDIVNVCEQALSQVDN
ncbi:cell division protein ZapA [Neisseria weaveri LMG 5135]|nr:cell division protein ZapA [Neisseria weaveri LMG 5135]